MKQLIKNDDGIATIVTISWGCLGILTVWLGSGGGQIMKWCSLIYRWVWGGIV